MSAAGKDDEMPRHLVREQTDESLRVERDTTDTKVAKRLEAAESAADDVIRIARERADRIVETARDDADREPGSSRGSEATVARERSRSDVVLEAERARADAILEHERAQRRAYLADFMTVERDATDHDLNGERAHADDLIAARDAVLGTISHDLRSMLAVLSLNVTVLVAQAPADASGDGMRRRARVIERTVARMNRLVGDLQDVVAIEAGKLGLVRDRVEVAEILRETLEAFGPIAAAKQVTLEAEGGAPALQAHIDGGRILQVLANLISNALKFTPRGGRVSIEVSTEGKGIHVAVRDTGSGIAADSLEVVFERFHQVGRDRRGLGLGLHISRSIVEAHGGRMWAESDVGAGSTFHFTLPTL